MNFGFGNTRIGGKSIFGNKLRKTRSNAGKKRGPRAGSKAYAKNTARAFAALPGSNVIVAANGGEVHVHNKPLRARTIGPRRQRKNAGVARPRRVKPNSKAQKTLRLRALARNVLGLKRVPRKGTLARATINQML